VVVGVGGLTSNVGKTTLMCDLLRAFPGWEAIKTTRGHYRSCGKDPHACCVSDLLGDQAVIRSGRDSNYVAGKDTARYWDAGAANVHWLIATDAQVADGIRSALELVKAPGVFVEGNSFTEHVRPDFFIMVVRTDLRKTKVTAKRAMAHASAVYLSGAVSSTTSDDTSFEQHFGGRTVPIFSSTELPELIETLQSLAASGDVKSATHQGVFAS
jgi:molybdopterin-guanine dinucleotide biosynthesis protein